MIERSGHRNEALRDSWFDAANAILATEGYGGLKLAPLCKRLRVTTGSFYYSFENWHEFTAALLDTWQRERTEQTIAIARQHDDPVERLMVLVQASADLMHRTEAAIRVWAGVDERVASIQAKVDADRYAVVEEAMVQLVGPDRAEQYAVWGLSTLIGFEMIAAAHDREHLMWALQRMLEDARDNAAAGRSGTP